MHACIVMLDFSTFSLSMCNISCKKNFFKCRTKIVSFLSWNSKKLLHCGILHQYPQSFPNTKFRLNIKILKFATNIALNRYFALEFQKANGVFKVNVLKFVNLQSFIQKQKNFKLGTKILFLT